MAHTIERREDGWWIIYPPYLDMGPYSTRSAAEDDARGVRRFDLENNRMRQRQLLDKRGLPGQLDLFA